MTTQPPAPTTDAGSQLQGASAERLGALLGFIAYLLWGIFPLYFHALEPAGAWEVLAHRIVWTLLLCLVVLLVRRDFAWVPPLAHRPRMVAGTGVAAVVLAVNWTVYVAAVSAGHVTDAALGYFLNPLVTVALGVLFLRERLRPLQWAAVAVGAVAAVYLTIDGRQVPVIALVLAFSFGTYGLMKKRIGASLEALQGLTVETALLAPAAAVILVVLAVSGQQTFTTGAPLHPTLLVLSGVVTAIPLLLFAAAARRVPLVTIGLLLFITPVMQLLCGVLFLGEEMPASRWVGFGIVWVALVLLTIDSLRAARRRRVIAAEAERSLDSDFCEPAP